jgi:hypothetical protein
MTRGSQVQVLAWGAGLAAAGAVIAYVLAGGRWAVAGVAIGAVAGAFAPSVYDVVRAKDAKREDLRGAVEKTVPRSWARLLDPRRELVGFVGRDEELASLVAWHEDDEAGRLRLVTGPGGVGKTRLAVELAGSRTGRSPAAQRRPQGVLDAAANEPIMPAAGKGRSAPP